jgi:hypothetical protein
MFCGNCGQEIEAGVRLCNRCGAALAAAPAELAPAAPLQPAAQYAGFWLRLVAAIIDGLLVEVVVIPLSFLVGLVIGIAGAAAHAPTTGIQLAGGFAGFLVGTGVS